MSEKTSPEPLPNAQGGIMYLPKDVILLKESK